MEKSLHLYYEENGKRYYFPDCVAKQVMEQDHKLMQQMFELMKITSSAVDNYIEAGDLLSKPDLSVLRVALRSTVNRIEEVLDDRQRQLDVFRLSDFDPDKRL